MTADEIIALLDLRPHPAEGGYFRETYRSGCESEPGAPFSGPRSWSTAIYYLLTPATFSSLHRLPGDEVFHFYLPLALTSMLAPPAKAMTVPA